MSITMNIGAGGSKPHIALTTIGFLSSKTNAVSIVDHEVTVTDQKFFQRESDDTFTCLKDGTYLITIGASATYIPASSPTLNNANVFCYINGTEQFKKENIASISSTVVSSTVSLSHGDTVSLMGRTQLTNALGCHFFMTIENAD